jgi:hypothetical protein
MQSAVGPIVHQRPVSPAVRAAWASDTCDPVDVDDWSVAVAMMAAGADDVIGYMRDRGVTLTYDPAAGTLQAGTCEAIKTIIRKAG